MYVRKAPTIVPVTVSAPPTSAGAMLVRPKLPSRSLSWNLRHSRAPIASLRWGASGHDGDEARTRSLCRELGKHPRTARHGLILKLGGHGHEPWLSVDDRRRPVLRARREHGRGERSWRTHGSDGYQLDRRARPVPGDQLPHWQAFRGRRGRVGPRPAGASP